MNEDGPDMPQQKSVGVALCLTRDRLRRLLFVILVGVVVVWIAWIDLETVVVLLPAVIGIAGGIALGRKSPAAMFVAAPIGGAIGLWIGSLLPRVCHYGLGQVANADNLSMLPGDPGPDSPVLCLVAGFLAGLLVAAVSCRSIRRSSRRAVVALGVLVAIAWLLRGTVFWATVTTYVKITFSEAKMIADPTTVRRANWIVFEITNESEEQHRFVVTQTDCPLDKLPTKDGKVRYITYFDEPRLAFPDGGGSVQQCSRGAETEVKWAPHRREPGIEITPGKIVEFRSVYNYEGVFESGRRFVLFCNEPGHYHRGEYAEIFVK